MPRILVVDDESRYCKILSLMLQPEHYEVVTATEGKTAARLLESVETEWVKGHNGDPGNEEADHHAGEAAQFGPWIHDTDEIPKSPVDISPGSSYISLEHPALVAKGIQ